MRASALVASFPGLDDLGGVGGVEDLEFATEDVCQVAIGSEDIEEHDGAVRPPALHVDIRRCGVAVVAGASDPRPDLVSGAVEVGDMKFTSQHDRGCGGEMSTEMAIAVWFSSVDQIELAPLVAHTEDCAPVIDRIVEMTAAFEMGSTEVGVVENVHGLAPVDVATGCPARFEFRLPFHRWDEALAPSRFQCDE